MTPSTGLRPPERRDGRDARSWPPSTRVRRRRRGPAGRARWISAQDAKFLGPSRTQGLGTHTAIRPLEAHDPVCVRSARSVSTRLRRSPMFKKLFVVLGLVVGTTLTFACSSTADAECVAGRACSCADCNKTCGGNGKECSFACTGGTCNFTCTGGGCQAEAKSASAVTLDAREVVVHSPRRVRRPARSRARETAASTLAPAHNPARRPNARAAVKRAVMVRRPASRAARRSREAVRSTARPRAVPRRRRRVARRRPPCRRSPAQGIEPRRGRTRRA